MKQIFPMQGKESGTQYKGYRVEGPRRKLFTDVTGEMIVVSAREAAASWSFLAVGAN